MKKRFFALALSLALIAPGFVLANQSTDALIAELKAKIAALTAKLEALQKAEREKQPWCHSFNANLKIGDEVSEVRALDIALRREGVGDPISLEGQPSLISDDGVFIEPTASAVSAF